MSNTQSPGLPRDRNGATLHVGQSVVITRDGHFVHGVVMLLSYTESVGWLASVKTRNEERIVACADACAITRVETTRRAAA